MSSSTSVELNELIKRKDKPHMKDIHNHVISKWASKWRQLGMQLNIDQHLMDIIEHDHSNDCERCCSKMFSKWLGSNPTASWEDIITAMDNLSSNGNEDVLKAASILRDCYKQSRYIPSDDDWPPYHPKHYTPLTIVHHEGRCTESEVLDNAQKLKTIGVTEKSKNSNKIHHRSIKEILAPFEESTSYPYMILIEGAPGIGKTIMSKEVAIQWANKNILKNIKLLFLLFMRDPKVKNIADVQSLVKFFCQSDTLTSKITEWLVETNGKYLAIVLDGYDEISTESRSHCIINRIVNRQMLPECAVIITSRPTASLHLHDKVTCRAEILGFSRECRQGFIQNALKGQNDKIKRLTDFLQSNPSLNALCYIPLNMSILLCLTMEGMDALPKSQTSLYQKFVLMTIIHFLKKDKGKITFNTTIKSLDDLPHPYCQVLKEVSQFAFLALQKDQLVFTLAEVKAEYPNLTPANWYGLGLLKPAQYFKAQDGCDHESFHFLHFSIQEYMAAYYIASLPGDKLSSMLKETFWNVHYFNTWTMYVGITGGRHFEFKHFLSGNSFQICSWWFGIKSISSVILRDKLKRLHLLRCSAEADHEMLSTVETIFQDEIIDLSNQYLSVNDVRILADLLLKLPHKKWKKLDLSSCSINDESCKLLYDLFLPNNIPLKIMTVDISFNNFHWDSLSKLYVIFRHWKVSKLIMSIEALYDDIATVDMVKHFKSKLNNKISTIGNRKYSAFRSDLILTYLPDKNRMIAVFACSCTLRCHVYTNCQPDDDLIQKILCFIQHATICIPVVAVSYHIPSHVINEKLSTISCHVAFRGLHMHSKGIFKLKQLPEIIPVKSYFKNTIADFVMAVIVHSYSQPNKSYIKTIPVPDAKHVKEHLQDCSTFFQMCASKTILDGKVASDIATVLSYNPNLRMLCFDGNNLQSTGAIKIAQALQHISTLSEFILSDNNIGKEAADDIASILSHNTKLKVLKLSRNIFQTTGAIKIAKALQNTFTLTTFEITDNNIDQEAADDIAAVLFHNTKLQEVDLSRNNLRTVGAIKIAQALQNSSTLTTFGIASNNIGEEAADDIAAVLFHNTKLQEVDLSRNNLRTVGAIKIAKALQNSSTLTTFGIASNNISEEAADDIAAVLFHNTKLQEVDLSRNNLRTVGAIKIAKALQNSSTLITFEIASNNIGEEAADDIASILSHNTELEVLRLSRNNFQTMGAIKIAKALQNTFTLTIFEFTDNSIDKEAADDIAAVLFHNTKLQEVDLSRNNLRTVGAIKIAQALQNSSTLTTFGIASNNIGEEAADDIAAVLFHNTKLQEVDLSRNNLRTVGAIKIAQALQNSSTLTTFGIASNNIGEEAADDIAAALSHNAKLQKLYLSDNKLKAIGVIMIAKVLENNPSTLTIIDVSNNDIGTEESAAANIASVLLGCHDLRELQLSGNNLQTMSIIKIARSLQKLSWLGVINFSDNNISEEAADDIAAALSHKKMLTKLDLGINNFQTTGIIKISRALKNIANLRELNISRNNIGDDAASDIAAVVSHNNKLQKLDLHRNQLQKRGIVIIAKELQNNTTLQLFNIAGNNISKEATDGITNILSCISNLEILI